MIHRLVLSLLICTQLCNVPLLATEPVEQGKAKGRGGVAEETKAEEKARQERVERELKERLEREQKEAEIKEKEKEEQRKREVAEKAAADRRAREEATKKAVSEAPQKALEERAQTSSATRTQIDTTTLTYDKTKAEINPKEPLRQQFFVELLKQIDVNFNQYQVLLAHEWPNFESFEKPGDGWAKLDEVTKSDIKRCIDFINDVKVQENLLRAIQNQTIEPIKDPITGQTVDTQQSLDVKNNLKGYKLDGLAKWLDANIKAIEGINAPGIEIKASDAKVSAYKFLRDFLPEKSVSYALQLETALDTRLTELNKKNSIFRSSAETAELKRLTQDAVDNYKKLTDLATIDMRDKDGNPRKGQSFTKQDLEAYAQKSFNLTANPLVKLAKEVAKKFSREAFKEYRTSFMNSLSVQIITGDPSNMSVILNASIPIFQNLLYEEAVSSRISSEDRLLITKQFRSLEQLAALSADGVEREAFMTQQKNMRRGGGVLDYTPRRENYYNLGQFEIDQVPNLKKNLEETLSQLANPEKLTPLKKTELTQDAKYQMYLIDRALKIAEKSYGEALKTSSTSDEREQATKGMKSAQAITDQLLASDIYNPLLSDARNSSNELTKRYDAEMDTTVKESEKTNAVEKMRRTLELNMGLALYPPEEPVKPGTKVDIRKAVRMIKLMGWAVTSAIVLYDLFEKILEEIENESQGEGLF